MIASEYLQCPDWNGLHSWPEIFRRANGPIGTQVLLFHRFIHCVAMRPSALGRGFALGILRDLLEFCGKLVLVRSGPLIYRAKEICVIRLRKA